MPKQLRFEEDIVWDRAWRRLGLGLFWLALFLLTVSCGRATPPQGAPPRTSSTAQKGVAETSTAEGVLRRFFELETKEDYENEYTLLSRKYRDTLLSKSKAKTAQQYREYRWNLEATWSEFAVTGMPSSTPIRATFTGSARVEENGEGSKVQFRCALVKEDGQWRIEEFSY